MMLLTLIFLLATTPAPSPWAILAERDVEAMYGQILANHPGPADTLNPQFNAWLEDGRRAALEKARQATTFGGFAYSLRFYGAGFRDGHLNSGTTLTESEIWWPRFIVRLRNDRYVIGAVADATDKSLPAVGSELLDCDGRTARQIVEEDIWPYTMGPKIDSAWPRAAAELLLDRGNPWAPRARECRFRSGDGTTSLAIRYARTNQDALNAAGTRAAATLAPLAPVRRINDVVWVSIPTFNVRDDETLARLKRLVSEAPAWRDAALVVFDVRGNDGGNSTWGQQMVEGLFGKEFVDTNINPKFAGQYVDWRVSKDNLDHVRDMVASIRRQQGEDSPAARSFQRVADGMALALEKGERLFRLPPSSDTGKTRQAERMFKGRVVLLTDRRCASACLDFADIVRLLPDSRHLGLATNADSVYMEVRPVTLPSGVGRLALPVKVYRNRPRGHNEPYLPHQVFEGDINDTAAVEKWLLDNQRHAEER